MPEPIITIEDNASVNDLRVIWSGLDQYNVAQTGLEGRLITVFLRNEEREVVGGAHGWTAFGWLNIRALWLREDQRRKGWGTRLLRATEAEAVTRGCRHAHLDTFSFQALGFYQKNGYRIFGELDDVAGKHQWYFLRKELA